MTAEVTVFKLYPTVDWVLCSENAGSKDTPIIGSVNAVDINLETADAARRVMLDRLQGDMCGGFPFAPYDTVLKVGDTVAITPTGGRPSNTTSFPFLNLQCVDQSIIAAIGWSGQWRAVFDRTSSPTRFTAGTEQTHLPPHPACWLRPGLAPAGKARQHAGDLWALAHRD